MSRGWAGGCGGQSNPLVHGQPALASLCRPLQESYPYSSPPSLLPSLSAQALTRCAAGRWT